MANLQKKRKRRFRFAAGYVIEQEGTEVVERLVRDGSRSRFGVRQEWVPAMKLENLNRSNAEEVLRKRVWRFRDYHKIDDALVSPTKIFDTQILFSSDVAINEAKQSLKSLGFDVDENGRLDPMTRKAIEDADSGDFLSQYEFQLEKYINKNHSGRDVLIRRVKNRPARNVDASPTTF